MLASVIERLAPRILWRHRATSWGFVNGDPEFALLPDLVDRNKMSIDIGGASGIYTAMLIPLSESVTVFEPVPRVAYELRKMFACTSMVRLEQVALSDQAGMVTIRVPNDRFWRSTIEPRNQLSHSLAVEEIEVTKKRLDDYAFRDVGFIKIDVEGHELAVLEGAVDTIRREKPTFIVEIEEQHRAGALNKVFGFFGDMGYAGMFLQDGKRRTLDSFHPGLHQDLGNLDERGEKCGLYINNFAFFPAARAKSLL